MSAASPFIETLRPIAQIVADYDTALALAERQARERFAALGLPGVSDAETPAAALPPPVSLALPEPAEYTCPECQWAGEPRKRGAKCPMCLRRKIKEGRAASKASAEAAAQSRLRDGAAMLRPGAATPPPPLPPTVTSYEGLTNRQCTDDLPAARSRGINDPQADEAGEFLIVLGRTHYVSENGKKVDYEGIQPRIGPALPTDKVIERVWRKGDFWYVTKPDGTDVRVGRHQINHIVRRSADATAETTAAPKKPLWTDRIRSSASAAAVKTEAAPA